ncbi:MAG: tRNA epoxyqueuosine(34) reductase QueG [Planctomycetota bacterium]
MIPPRTLREMAHEAGFDLVRFGPVEVGDHADHFARWLDAGRAGDMHYLHRNRARIVDPHLWAPDARSVMALAVAYGPAGTSLPGGGRIARYAAGRDYHRVLGNATRKLAKRLQGEGVDPAHLRLGVDAVPVLERALAVRAGIGFLAKSSMVISPDLGPYLSLAELTLPFVVDGDGPAPGSCGTCTRCLDACPTGAIVAPFQVDARRCLSYTTIELRGAIPHELRAAQGDWLFGCDVCLEVCPFTRFAGGGGALGDDLRRTHPALETFTLTGVLELGPEDYERHWVGTAVRRATRQGLRRNAAIVLGNRRDPSATPALARALADDDAVVRGHAAWALGRLGGNGALLAGSLAREPDAWVRDEIETALAGGEHGA